jgi:hypothetical protein
MDGIRLLSKDDELLFDLQLYRAADNLRRLAPWEFLFGDELFGVQVPGSDLVYFVNVMGQRGEFTALSFYKGYAGLTDFLEFMSEVEQLADPELSEDGMQHASVMIGNPMTIPHLMLSFMDREHLHKKDLAAIKRSGVAFRGKGNWPSIEEIVPGYVPVYPERERLVELYLLMQQTLIVLEKAKEDASLLQQEGDVEPAFLVRVPHGNGPRFKWKEVYLELDPLWAEPSFLVDVSPGDRKALAGLPEASQILQVELFMLPTPVKEKGSRPYFPFALLMVDAYTGMVTGVSTLSPQPDLRSMYESVPGMVVDELKKLGHRPSDIMIRTGILYDLLVELLESAGCQVDLVDWMPEMDEAMTSFLSRMT